MLSVKPRKCANKECRQEFIPARSFQKAHSIECAIKLAEQDRERKARVALHHQRANDRKRAEAIKTVPQLIKEAQIAFNAWIRARDAGKPCICCGRYSSGETRGGDWDAGHYRSRGAAPHLRFNEDNVHSQLKQCNRYGAGRAVDYRLGLIARIGIARVEALEANNEPHKWTRDELRAIAATYKAKLKELKS
ncbi:recombination protein NinG [Uliginosibacterium sp. sgz301328]